ncbi:MAG: hypothetical protein KAT70_03565, partial [Thermoplasmata archaeon]|nr:hypothetical protein [Thermoplasmata archaeon]
MELDTNELYVHYSTDGGANYLSASMTNVGGDVYSADIPGQILGTTVCYYISAKDTANSPNTGFDPFGAPAINYTFDVVNALPLLLVDASDNVGFINPYIATLDSIGQTYDLGDEASSLDGYNTVIWVERGGAPDHTDDYGEQDNITAFLNAGGNLYINGEDIGYQFRNNVTATLWYNTYLHAAYDDDDSGATLANGVSGDPITDGMSGLPITSSWPELMHIPVADPDADVMFTYVDGAPGTPAAIRADTGTYKTVYIAYRYFESGDAQANKDDLMQKILYWLNPAGAVPIITHTPLGDTHSTSDYTVTAEITDDSLATTTLYWCTDGTSFDHVVPMVVGVGDNYSANIDGQAWGTTVSYYIRATDGDSNVVTDPSDAPVSAHAFLVDEDTEAPVIVHTPRPDSVGSNPYPIVATVTDNIELDATQVFVHYNMNGGAVYTPIPMTNTGGDEYSASIPGQPIGTTIYYYISAKDTSVAHNMGVHPAGAPATNHSFDIVTKLPLLVVDAADIGTIGNYTTALDNLGISYSLGSSVSHILSEYQNVIWIEDDDPPDAEERANLTAFMDGGGNLYINGEDLGDDLGTVGVGESPGFYADYLHADHIDSSAVNEFIDGVPGDPITDGMNDLELNWNWANVIAPYDATASSIFTFDGSADVAGIKADTGTYKVVYISGQYFEHYWEPQAGKDLLMERILTWLNPDLLVPTIIHTPLVDTEDTSNPYPVVANITDNDLDTKIMYWSTDGVSYTPVTMSLISGDDYTADIPAQISGTTAYYYIEATNTAGFDATHPDGAPAVNHTFYVGVDADPPIIEHTPLT